jgi:hypothetical protein
LDVFIYFSFDHNNTNHVWIVEYSCIICDASSYLGSFFVTEPVRIERLRANERLCPKELGELKDSTF